MDRAIHSTTAETQRTQRSRRDESIELMKLSSALLLLLALLSLSAQRANKPSSKHDSGQVGLQLYSLRNQFKTDVPRTLDQVRAFGIKYVELAGTYGVEPKAFNEELKAKGLRAISAHYSTSSFETILMM